MIPKVIHYCWFGGKPEPMDVQVCIESWKKFCPDYEIIRWDENNYDVHKCQYMSDAYKEKKWAFVSDYCRIDILYQYGGVYLDTDVELVKPLDDLLKEKLFCGFESRDPLMKSLNLDFEEQSVAFGLGYGAVKEHPVLAKLLSLYASLSFYKQDGSLNLVACPRYQTQVLTDFGLIANGKTQRFEGGIAFSFEYFCPMSNIETDKILKMTDDTYSIHHFTSTWSDYRGKKNLRNKLSKILGFQLANFVTNVIYYPIKRFRK